MTISLQPLFHRHCWQTRSQDTVISPFKKNISRHRTQAANVLSIFEQKWHMKVLAISAFCHRYLNMALKLRNMAKQRKDRLHLFYRRKEHFGLYLVEQLAVHKSLCHALPSDTVNQILQCECFVLFL